MRKKTLKSRTDQETADMIEDLGLDSNRYQSPLYSVFQMEQISKWVTGLV
jgi:hypothetical protein